MCRQRRVAVGLVLVTLIAASACSSDTNESVDTSGTTDAPTTTEATPVTTESPPVTTPTTPSPGATVTVSATGTSSGKPDRLTLNVGVETKAATVGEAMNALSLQSRALFDYLDSQGTADADRSTESLSVYPAYEYLPEGSQPSGYQASMQIVVHLNDIQRAPAVVDGAAVAVGDSLRVYGLSWSMTNLDELQARARTHAVEIAREQAEQLAGAAGMIVGEVRSIDETAPFDFPRGEGDFGGGGSGIPFEAGEQTVQVNVSVTFDLLTTK